jgi:hypothetical protein
MDNEDTSTLLGKCLAAWDENQNWAPWELFAAQFGSYSEPSIFHN